MSEQDTARPSSQAEKDALLVLLAANETGDTARLASLLCKNDASPEQWSRDCYQMVRERLDKTRDDLLLHFNVAYDDEHLPDLVKAADRRLARSRAPNVRSVEDRLTCIEQVLKDGHWQAAVDRIASQKAEIERLIQQNSRFIELLCRDGLLGQPVEIIAGEDRDDG